MCCQATASPATAASNSSNASLIINAGREIGVPVKGQAIGVMTAMGESSLRVLGHGDVAGPDSRGLFQQRANGAWGSLAGRMDPTVSATNFFKALLALPGWEQLPPTIAAHRVQGNLDLQHYAKYWPAAVQVVERVAGVTVGDSGPTGCSGGAAAASNGAPGGGWVRPAAGAVTSPFGMRTHPVLGGTRLHAGADIEAPCGAPIVAAHRGVRRPRPSRSLRDWRRSRRWLEVQRSGTFVDPVPFMASHGVQLGA